jgi:hypothetical protein
LAQLLQEFDRQCKFIVKPKLFLHLKEIIILAFIQKIFVASSGQILPPPCSVKNSPYAKKDNDSTHLRPMSYRTTYDNQRAYSTKDYRVKGMRAIVLHAWLLNSKVRVMTYNKDPEYSGEEDDVFNHA